MEDAPFAGRMCIAEYAAAEKLCMDTQETFGVNSAAHVVDICFSSSDIQACKVSTAKGVNYPSRLVLFGEYRSMGEIEVS